MREPKPRWPTAAAIRKLAKRFEMPIDPHTQDWEYEVADPERIDEFLAAYNSSELDEDERFTLMETLIESFEDLGEGAEAHSRWPELIRLLEENAELHASTLWSWSCPGSDVEDSWRVTPYMREVIQRRREVFEAPQVG